MDRVHVVKIIKEEVNHFKNLKAFADPAEAKKMPDTMNKKGFKGIRYEVEDVSFIDEEVSEDDF